MSKCEPAASHVPLLRRRENTSGNSPVTDLASNDLRCNTGKNIHLPGVESCLPALQLATDLKPSTITGATGSGVETTSVAAGSTVSFTLDIAVYHQGPVMWYLGKVPSGQTADSWDGSGTNWFKIAEVGPDFSTGTGGAATWPLARKKSPPPSLPPSLPHSLPALCLCNIRAHWRW